MLRLQGRKRGMISMRWLPMLRRSIQSRPRLGRVGGWVGGWVISCFFDWRRPMPCFWGRWVVYKGFVEEEEVLPSFLVLRWVGGWVKGSLLLFVRRRSRGRRST